MVIKTDLRTVYDYGNWQAFCEVTGYDPDIMTRYNLLSQPDDLIILVQEDFELIFGEGFI